MSLLEGIANKIYTAINLFKLTGIKGILVFKTLPNSIINILDKIGISLKNKKISLKFKSYQHPVWLRYGTSDPGILYQIFLFQEYSCLDDLSAPKLIIDAGANVGFSSVYFLNKYPNAHVIAIEPDKSNFDIARKNLSYYQPRALLINAGIWSHDTKLIVERGNGRNECGFQVRECFENEKSEVNALGIDSLLKNSGFETIDLLKIDIEGSETILFSENHQNWLNKVKNIVIELHGEECEEKFFRALSTYNYELSNYGELTVCKRLSHRKPIISSIAY
ncbi:MAG: FkbM family methyltransferase [Cyanobacteria bacterium P01_A01_bin.84]